MSILCQKAIMKSVFYIILYFITTLKTTISVKRGIPNTSNAINASDESNASNASDASNACNAG